jgi:hypothetical protein
MPGQLASLSSVAASRGAPYDVPENVRRVPAKWVRPWSPRLALLATWPGIVGTHHTVNLSEVH